MGYCGNCRSVETESVKGSKYLDHVIYLGPEKKNYLSWSILFNYNDRFEIILRISLSTYKERSIGRVERLIFK
jgi:hypothetical protein